MQNNTFKKPIDLKKIKYKADNLYENRKLIFPMIFGISGIFFGNYTGKGESALFLKITDIFKNIYFNQNYAFFSDFLTSLIVPSVLFFISFLLAMSLIGVVLSNAVPFAFGTIIGIISFFMYDTYSLKGLAYCVLIIYPYASITMLSIVLNTKESINMSQLITSSISKRTYNNNYQFVNYAKSLLRNYIILLSGALVKVLMGYFFSFFFSF